MLNIFPRSRSLKVIKAFLPIVEPLETRLVPADILFKGGFPANPNAWSEGRNWVGGVVPGKNDTAIFEDTIGAVAVVSPSVVVDQTIQVGEIDMPLNWGDNHSITVAKGVILTTSSINQEGGTIRGQGAIHLNANGSWNWTGGQVQMVDSLLLFNAGRGSIFLDKGATWSMAFSGVTKNFTARVENAGSIIVKSGTLNLVDASIANVGTFEVRSNLTGDNASKFTNVATMTMNTPGTNIFLVLNLNSQVVVHLL